MREAPSRTGWLVGGTIAVVLVMGGSVWVNQRSHEPSPEDPEPPVAPSTPSSLGPGRDPGPGEPTREAPAEVAAEARPGAGREPPAAPPRISRQQWDERRRVLRAAQPPARRVPEKRAQAAAAQTAGEAPGTLPRDYIQERVREIVPLVRECYELGLEEEPSLAGRMVARFTIVGDPDIGGIVEEVTLGEESDLESPVVEECVRETMYTLELAAPEEGGRVVVNYPFQFRPED